MRLVDADWLLKELSTLGDSERGNKYNFYGIESAKEIIENADKVEIIRCEDCVFHSDMKTTISKSNSNIRYCEFIDMHTPNDGYCFYAKRKDDKE